MWWEKKNNKRKAVMTEELERGTEAGGPTERDSTQVAAATADIHSVNLPRNKN